VIKIGVDSGVALICRRHDRSPAGLRWYERDGMSEMPYYTFTDMHSSQM
jgi:hypothetical protein